MKKSHSKKLTQSQSTIRHHVVPAVVWLTTVVCIFGLLHNRAQQIQVLGVVRGTTHRIAANCPGRIHDIGVQLYDYVQKDQLLITIDTLTDDKRLANQFITKELEAEVIKKSGAWFSYGEERLGQGRENAKLFLAENPDIAEELETRLRVALGMIAPTESEAAPSEDPAPAEAAPAD